MKSLLEMLSANRRIPMHMPGHKRNTALAPYLARLSADLDITEIEGFDDLHNPEGVLKKTMERAAALRGADRAFYLINGSTGGILSAILAAVPTGGKVICARNCHKSVYNALELACAETVFVSAETDEKTGICTSVDPRKIKNALDENPGARLVILTSPTYEGIVSDVAEICRIAHKNGVPVLVDAAHGAHFGFGGGFPQSAARLGADISVESLHKTLPSLTQTAVCYHSGTLIDPSRVAEKLAVFETSSPSYLLLASIDGCFGLLSEKAGELFSDWGDRLDFFYEKAADFKNITLFDGGKSFDTDRSKIVLLGDGRKISSHLRSFGIEPEMTMPNYTVLMTGLGDTRENFESVLYALSKYDGGEEQDITVRVAPLPERVMSIRSAKLAQTEYIDCNESGGRICAEYIRAYPPGIPLIVPGEKISAEIAEVIEVYESRGFDLHGGTKRRNGKILVVK